MPSSSSPDESAGRFTMEWISTNDFTLPAGTIQTTFKTRFLSFLKSGRASKSMDDTLKPESLESLPLEFLDHLAPTPDWKDEALSLDEKLLPWCESPGNNFVLILNVPCSGNATVLKYWAAEHGYRIIDPPNPRDLLKPDEKWFAQFENPDTIWVLPALEECWLRHESGLWLVRQFFRRLLSGQLGPGVLGCGSWAWAFFRHALGVSAPVSLTVRPFDAETLRSWFSALAFKKNHRKIHFLQADNGNLVLSCGVESSNSQNRKPSQKPDQKTEQSFFLKDLAAFSYGIPGVAMAYWRASLQLEPDTTEPENTGKNADPVRSTIWVKPWMNVERPGLPSAMKRHHAFILHNLLLHNTLDMDTLSKLLPAGHHLFDQCFYDLSDNGLISFSENQWQVTPKGYPVVRGFLKTEGFLSDDFR